MARYYYPGGRDTVEQAKSIDFSWLRKNDYFVGYRSGNVNWSRNGESTGSIYLKVDVDPENPYIKFTYKARKYGAEEWKSIDFSFRLESVPCRFGGKKWFYICGLYSNGKYCGRRARVVYQAGDYFGCRKCANLSYESCNLSGIQKSFGKIISIPELEKMEAEVKRTHYKGKPTKKYLRYLRMMDRFETGFAGMVMFLDGKVNKIKRNK